ncbi:MAG TPA: hypothetical protein VKC60_05775 [Opitutaceae bacterium]|nr:hypothetical protein [Opitutaceae bacterium]
MSSEQITTPPNAGMTLAFLSLRLWLGVRALVAGVEKFSEKMTVQEPLRDANGVPDSSGAIVEVSKKVYGLSHYHALPESLKTKFLQEPLLPTFLTTPFYASLGYILVLSGVALLLGVGTRASLFVMAVLYTFLTVGLMLINQQDGVAWLGIHVGLIALALTLVHHNRFALLR